MFRNSLLALGALLALVGAGRAHCFAAPTPPHPLPCGRGETAPEECADTTSRARRPGIADRESDQPLTRHATASSVFAHERGDRVHGRPLRRQGVAGVVPEGERRRMAKSICERLTQPARARERRREDRAHGSQYEDTRRGHRRSSDDGFRAGGCITRVGSCRRLPRGSAASAAVPMRVAPCGFA